MKSLPQGTRRVYRANEALSYGARCREWGTAMKFFLALVLLFCATASFGASTQSTLLKRFLKESSVQYGGVDDARTLEGRLYAWAKAGDSISELEDKAGKEFELP